MSAIPLYRDAARSVADRVSDLLKRMTLEEKVDQLIQITRGADENPENRADEIPFRPTVGSILSFSGGAEARNRIQRQAVEDTRLGIPILWGHDVIHGWRTGFPVPLAQACTWDPELIEESCRIAAVECSAEGVRWTFSPMVDVPHDPRWGRVMEGYGEDPYAAGIYAQAAVRGYQTGDPSRPDAVAACLKHFVGYAAGEGGRDYEYTDISARRLHDTYLPPFQAGVEAGAMTLMSSFNDITGIPAAMNAYTLTEVLRNRWGFTGFVVSDWAGIRQIGAQGITRDRAEQGRRALEAGNDMDMMNGCFEHLPELVKAGKLDVAVIDRAVGRVLGVKFRLGLFEHPYSPEKPQSETSLQPASREAAVRAAREAAVLLKNNGALLPLPATLKRIALIGPAADDPRAPIGNWPGRIEPETMTTYRQELPAFFPEAEFRYAEGCGYETDSEAGFAEAVAAAEASEVVLAVLGEPYDRTGENQSRADIALPGRQAALLKALKATGKPVVLLTVSGRPILYPELEPNADAILHLWHAGHGAGRACGELLTGQYNPSGRLAITFPRAVGQIPIYYNRHRRARPDQGNYHDLEESPMYEFGYGLSYTEFVYGTPELTADRQFRVLVRNAGGRAGTETVLLYLSDPEANLTQPIKRLIAFTRLDLAPGEEKAAEFPLIPERDFAYIGPDGKRALESGELVLTAGGRALSFEFVPEKW